MFCSFKFGTGRPKLQIRGLDNRSYCLNNFDKYIYFNHLKKIFLHNNSLNEKLSFVKYVSVVIVYFWDPKKISNHNVDKLFHILHSINLKNDLVTLVSIKTHYDIWLLFNLYKICEVNYFGINLRYDSIYDQSNILKKSVLIRV